MSAVSAWEVKGLEEGGREALSNQLQSRLLQLEPTGSPLTHPRKQSRELDMKRHEELPGTGHSQECLVCHGHRQGGHRCRGWLLGTRLGTAKWKADWAGQ